MHLFYCTILLTSHNFHNSARQCEGREYFAGTGSVSVVLYRLTLFLQVQFLSALKPQYDTALSVSC